MRKRLKVNSKQIKLFGIILLILALPLTLILVRQIHDQRSSAALPDNLETEAGVLSLTGVSKQIDSGASGNIYVLFNKQVISPTPNPILNNIGPRYNLYGAGASGNFPPFPTGSNVVIVPASYVNNIRAVSDFINSQPNNTVIVFDSSGNGDYGDGTIYNMSEILYLNSNNKLREGIVLWGYNAKLKLNSDGIPNSFGDTFAPGIVTWTGYGGWKNIEMRGFDIEGGNELAFESNTRSGAIENQKGIWVFPNYDGFKILDNYIHNVGGDTIFLNGDYPRRYVAGWSDGPWPRNMEVGYNQLQGSGNQSVNINYAYGLDIHHNIITNAGLFPVDLENGNNWPSGYRWFRNISWRNNGIGGWAQYCVNPMPWGPSYAMSENMDPNNYDLIENWSITDNEFVDGAAGYGNPSIEMSVFGKCITCGASDLPNFFSSPQVAAFWSNRWATKNNLIFSRNKSYLPADQIKGYAMTVAGWNGVTIEDNSLQGLPFVTYLSSGVFFNRNGTSIKYDSWQGAK